MIEKYTFEELNQLCKQLFVILSPQKRKCEVEIQILRSSNRIFTGSPRVLAGLKPNFHFLDPQSFMMPLPSAAQGSLLGISTLSPQKRKYKVEIQIFTGCHRVFAGLKPNFHFLGPQSFMMLFRGFLPGISSW